jgi:hypothetical protein
MMSTRGFIATPLLLAALIGGTLSGLPLPAQADTGGTVYLRTVPALAGVQLQVGSTAVTTGGDGTATVSVSNLNGVARTVELGSTSLDADTSVAISKVVTAPHVAAGASHISVGLDVSENVTVNVRSGDSGVPASAVRQLRLHSITGERLTISPQQNAAVTLLARRTRLEHGALVSRPVVWSVDRVRAYSGAVLTTANPRFDPLGRHVWRVRLASVAGTVWIQTVPATPGVALTIENQVTSTDGHGRAKVAVGDLNDVDRHLRLGSHDAAAAKVTLRAVRRLPPGGVHQRRLLAALSVRKPVMLRFLDAAGHVVPPQRITEIRLAGAENTIVLHGAQLTEPIPLGASLGTQVNRVWQQRRLSYAVTSVRIDGGEAVFAGRQRLDANDQSTWTFTLAVYRLTLKVRDVIFGTRVASQVWIARPNGSRLRLNVGTDAASTAPSLVRGEYAVTVDAAIVGQRRTALVSRNSDLDLRVVTPLDAVIIVLVVLGLATGAVYGGVRAKRRRARNAGAAR